MKDQVEKNKAMMSFTKGNSERKYQEAVMSMKGEYEADIFRRGFNMGIASCSDMYLLSEEHDNALFEGMVDLTKE